MQQIEVSIVIPCLNEAETLGEILAAARAVLDECDVEGEIIVADNGSTDGSDAIATHAGARLVRIAARGYGHALMGGIGAARGRFVVMGDADGQHDFRDVGAVVARLREGFELVQGCRLPAGGGRVNPGSMPWSHRWLGNPMFSWMARHWFGVPLHDVYCGFRGFRRELAGRLNLRCTGMEFAIEMILKASLARVRMTEVPITVHAGRRMKHAAHMRTFRDGWRTLRFFLLYSPTWLFLIPGAGLMIAGGAGYALALTGVRLGGLSFEATTLLLSSVFVLCGYQSVVFALIAKTFAANEGLQPEDPRLARFFQVMNLEKGLLVGAAALAIGTVLVVLVLDAWRQGGFRSVDFARVMRLAIPGALLVALGFQTILSSFLVSMAGLRRR